MAATRVRGAGRHPAVRSAAAGQGLRLGAAPPPAGRRPPARRAPRVRALGCRRLAARQSAQPAICFPRSPCERFSLALSVPSSALSLRPQTAPYLSLCGPSRLLAGLGDRAWAGKRRRPRLAAAVELPGELPAPGPRLCRCRRRCFSTADSSRPPAAAPRALHGPGSPAFWLRRAPLSARPEAAPRRLGGAARRVPASRRHRLPLASVLPSTLQNQPTKHSGPSSGEGRGGAGREVGEPGGGGGGARGAQLEPAFLLPGAKPSSQPFSPASCRAPQKRCARPLGFLEHF